MKSAREREERRTREPSFKLQRTGRTVNLTGTCYAARVAVRDNTRHLLSDLGLQPGEVMESLKRDVFLYSAGYTHNINVRNNVLSPQNHVSNVGRFVKNSGHTC